jgi:L-lactate dehydrogenase (cytochrome)
MNEFAELLAGQVRADLRRMPGLARGRRTTGPRAGTIGELRAAARRRLPRAVFDYLDGAAGDEVTAARNTAELRALELHPRVLAGVSQISLATSVLGQPVALPLLAAPMGLTGLLHPDGEVALARAVHAAGSVCVLSAMASCPVEEVAGAADGRLWFQMYLWRDRGLVREILDRVRSAGVTVLVLTVDVPCSGGRDRDRRNGFTIPPRVTLRTLADGARHPRWTAGFLRRPRIGWGNLPPATGPAGVALSAHTNQHFDPAATWADLAWFREQWPGQFVAKGVLRAEDAGRAVRLGADAVIVSNHGGRQLDGAPAAIRALPAVADAVAGAAEVYLDGGIRRGADVVKALALGARACLAGRALGYGLAAAGEAGVGRAVTILREELRTALTLAGCPSVHAIDSSWVYAPGGSAPR